MKLTFTLAQMEQLDSIVIMFENAILEMENQGIYQWDELYPNREILKEDIRKNQLYVAWKEENIAAVYVLNQECDREYEKGKWKYPDASFYVVHRLCVNPDFQHQGIARQTMQYIENCLKQKGVESIRLDAFTKNPYALNLYQALQFQIVGYVDWRKGKFCLMEKSVKRISKAPKDAT